MVNLTCNKCKHQWQPRIPTPIQCPRCKSYTWDGKKKENENEIQNTNTDADGATEPTESSRPVEPRKDFRSYFVRADNYSGGQE